MDIAYFNSRPVVSVDEGGPDDNTAWTITLEAGGKIYCLDETHEMPQLQGLALTASETAGGVTRVYFGTNENPHGTVVVLREGEYAISDDSYTGGEIVTPGAQESAGVPVDETWQAERTADGPSEEYLAEQARLAEEAEAVDE